jgi:ERCC4-type nuclease
MSLSEIRAADESALAEIKGISAADAHAIYEYFKEKRKEGTTRVKNNNRNG